MSFSIKHGLLALVTATLVFSSCISCAGYSQRVRRSQVTVDSVSRSTLKMTVHSKVDATPIFEQGYISVPIVPVAKSGTAFVVATMDDHSLLMTAGHVCEQLGAKFDGIDGTTVIGLSYIFESVSGEIYSAVDVLVDDDNTDVCVLLADDKIGPSLALANSDPKNGTEAMYIGAPGGFWVEGFVPIFQGLFGGTIKSDGVYKSLVTVWGEGGASGSPLFIPGRGIIAVLTNNTHADTGGSVTVGVNWRTLGPILSDAKKKAREYLDARPQED